MDILDILSLLLAPLSIAALIWAYRHKRAVLRDADDWARLDPLTEEEQHDRPAGSRYPYSLRVVLLGLAQVTLGTAILLERLTNADLIYLLERLWPFLIVVAALTNTLRLAGRPLLMPLLLLFLLAIIAFHSVDIYLYDGTVYPFLWPLSLVIVGVWLAIAGAGLDKAKNAEPTHEVRETVVLRAARVTSTAEDLSLARIRVFVGSVEVDLRDSTISPRAEIQITLILARAWVLLPIGTDHVVRRFGVSTSVASEGESEARPRVLITCLQFLGHLIVTEGSPRRRSAEEQDR
jgi:hypothetical protein